MDKKIVAVVPTYNSAPLILDLVGQLQQKNFNKIIVCDDDSDDDSVARLKKKFGDSIIIKAGSQNVGPAGNRNRCLDELASDEIVFFIDADCKLVYAGDLLELIDKIFKDTAIGVAGFSISNKKGELIDWNYGDLMHPVLEAVDEKVKQLYEDGVISQEQFVKYAPSRAASLRLIEEKRAKEVGWVAEGCMAVRAKVLRAIGGFASEMRYHETHDFCARIKEAGYKVVFYPELVAKHLEFDSRMERRSDDFRAGRFYYYQTHWGMSEAVFRKLYGDK